MWEFITGFDPATLTAFILAGLVLNLTPGADFVFVTASGISGGPRAGLAAAVGVTSGVAVHIAAAAAGISALLIAYPATYDAIRYAGAAYLVFIAVQAWRASGDLAKGRAAIHPSTALWRGFLTNLLNPKTALFIFAFIPQFTDPAIGSFPAQILFLGLIFWINGTILILLLGLMAGKFTHVLRRHVKLLNKLTAILFGGLAARLIID